MEPLVLMLISSCVAIRVSHESNCLSFDVSFDNLAV